MESSSYRSPATLPAAPAVVLRDRRRNGNGGGDDAGREARHGQAQDREPQRDHHGFLCCLACRVRVTSLDARAQQAGRHEHLCENPDGVVFRIGCFDAAPGCVMIGRPSSHWTWFPGYRWRVALCGRCGAHLGWQFRDGGGGTFFGLIVDRLRPCDGREG